METNRLKLGKLPQPPLRLLCITLLLLGIVFRLANLDSKVYWGDETFSSSRIAGYSAEEIIGDIYTGEVISATELQKYQTPNSDRNLTNTLRIIGEEAPQHPPVYYILARFWEQWLGSSLALKRTLPALISLLGLPCLYWLCLELFGASLTPWLAVSLFAVSPIHILYAQEVREYSLWTVSILLSSASLLRAMRVNSRVSWCIYALSVALSFYSHLFSAPIILGHGIYVLIIAGWQGRQRVIAYISAVTAALLIFSPWLAVFLENEPRASKEWGWVIKELPPLDLGRYWLKNLLYGFFDVPLGKEYPFDLTFSYTQPRTYLVVPIVVLVIYGLYSLCRYTPKQVWLFVLLLMGFTSLPLVLPDVISGGMRSTIARYQLPTYIGIQLTISYLLSRKLSKFSIGIWQKRLWRLTTVILLSCGVISGVLIVQAETWWTKYSDYYNADVANIINQSPAPLVLSDSTHNRILSMSHKLDPKVKLKLIKTIKNIPEIPEEKLPKISGNFSDIFVLENIPSPSLLRSSIEKHSNYKFNLIYEGNIGFKKRKVLLWKKID
ncbi:MAG: hypothetical protein F6J98_31740 [Moorea sp. SIO4G2]|nr:hypothetical protein [Moorena sp. SIO4G2]